MELFIPLILFCIPMSVTPGPNNIMLMMSGLNYGVKNSIPHWLGVCLGFPAMVFAVGIGFGTLFVKFPLFHQAIKIIGVLYMLYLTWKIATASTHLSQTQQDKPFKFYQAVLFQWINPKAWVGIIAAISAYTTIGGNIPLEISAITTAFFLAMIPSTALWLLFSMPLKTLLKNQTHQRIFNYSMGILLAASILMILFE